MLQTSTLANGLRVITRSMPGTHSAALGIWLINGGRHQTDDECGYAHFLEHLLFKGTVQLDTLALSLRFEGMGGQINAHTGRELTAFHGLVPGRRVTELLHLFADMLLAPRFQDEDLELERDVVLQEMSLIEDSPGELVEDLGVEQVWKDHPIGWPILGRREVIRQANAEAMHAYLQKILTGARICVVGAGAVDHAELVDACKVFAALPNGDPLTVGAPVFRPAACRYSRETAQTQLLWLLPVPPATDPAYPALIMANHILGGGTASRLFQEVREQRGLVYAIHSRLENYSDTGLWMIQTACDPERTAECRQAVEQSVAGLLQAVGDDELHHTRDHLEAGLLIEEDDPDAAMERIARESLYLGRVVSLEERLAQMATVSAKDVQSALTRAWDKRAVVALEPKD